MNKEVSHTSGILRKKPLSHVQRVYLRLVLHNYADKEIAQFLEMSLGKALRIKLSILNKFGTDDLRQVLFETFKQEVLNHSDFMEELVKEEALKFTNKIFLKTIMSSPSPFWPQNSVRKLILDFNNSCKERFLNEASSLPRLKSSQIKFLQYYFNGKGETWIMETMKLSHKSYLSLERQILDFFSVNCMYNAVRKGLQYGIIKDDSNYIVGKQAHILNKAIESISSLRNLNLGSNQLHKLHIFESLLEYYGLSENYLLFKEDWNTCLTEVKSKEAELDLVINLRDLNYLMSV